MPRIGSPNLVVVARRVEVEHDVLRSIKADAERRREELEGRPGKSPKAKKENKKKDKSEKEAKAAAKEQLLPSRTTWKRARKALRRSFPALV